MKITGVLLRLATIVGVMTLSPVAFAGGDKDADTKFKTMDTNGDGKLSPEEHTIGVQKKFVMIDTNKDGQVTVAEMETFHEKMGKKGKKPEMSVSEKIKVIDTNADGVVSTEEYSAGATMMFDKMDANKDGYVTKQEMSAGHSKMMKKTPPPSGE